MNRGNCRCFLVTYSRCVIAKHRSIPSLAYDFDTFSNLICYRDVIFAVCEPKISIVKTLSTV